MPYVIQMPASRPDEGERYCYFMDSSIGRSTFMAKSYDTWLDAKLALDSINNYAPYKAPEIVGDTFHERLKKIRIVKLETVNKRRRSLGLNKLQIVGQYD